MVSEETTNGVGIGWGGYFSSLKDFSLQEFRYGEKKLMY